MKEMIERFEKKVAHLIEELKAELGLSGDTGAHTDSGGGPKGPPTIPGGG